jgi:hypothetical protein
VFPVRYGLDLYILFKKNSVFKALNNKGKGGESEQTVKRNIKHAFLCPICFPRESCGFQNKQK